MLDFEDVIQRIEDSRPTLQAAFSACGVVTSVTSIGGAIFPQLETQRIGSTSKIDVIQESESAQADQGLSSTIQRHAQRVVILFTISNKTDREGRYAQRAVKAFRMAMLGGCCDTIEPILLGWQPPTTQTPFVLISGGMIAPQNGVFQYQLLFETSCYLRG